MKKVQLLLAMLLIGSSLNAQDPNLHIYLCFGQSNMEGQGNIESQDLEVNERFKVFQALDCPNLGREKENWYPAVPPNCQCYTKLSPADYFGKTMIENYSDEISVGIINVAVGGCDIRLFDKFLYALHDSTYVESWFLNKVAAYEGNPYKYLIDLAKLAQQDGVIKGILLHQGETNTGQSLWPTYVEKIYNHMLSDLSLEAEDVPLLAGELVSAPDNCCSSMNPIINLLPDVIPNAHVVSSEGCTAADGAHFDSEGYRLLGQRYAEKMLTLIDPNIVSGIDSAIEDSDFTFHGLYPNPSLDSVVNLKFHLSIPTYMSINLFNASGLQVAEVVNSEFPSGEHSLKHQIHNIPAGSYHYVIKAGEMLLNKPLVIP